MTIGSGIAIAAVWAFVAFVCRKGVDGCALLILLFVALSATSIIAVGHM